MSFTLLAKEAVPPSPSGQLFWADAIWSGTDPAVIFGHTFDKLWSYDAGTKQYTLVKDFAPLFPGEYQWQMSKSMDDNVFSFTRRELDTFAVLGYMAWRRDTRTSAGPSSASTGREATGSSIGRSCRWRPMGARRCGGSRTTAPSSRSSTTPPAPTSAATVASWPSRATGAGAAGGTSSS